MNKLIFLGLIATLAISTSYAKIRRVGFFANQIPNQDYTTFALAYADASNNDTILVFPGINMGNPILEKKLTIIGMGYWLDPNATPKGNANMQAFAGIAASGSMSIKSGAGGSVIMGIDFGGAYVYVSADDITFRRNHNFYVNLAYNVNGAANTPYPVNNLKLLENYRLGIFHSYAGFSNTNINISNNFMYSFNLNTTGTYSGVIANNTFAYDGTTTATNGGPSVLSSPSTLDFGAGAWLVQNNIFASYTNSASASNYNYFIFDGAGNSVFNYNLAIQSYNVTTWPTGTGNIFTPIANASSIFAAFPSIGSNTADARYQLAANSPALVANRPGSTVDAGMFGGLNPYKLSLIPSTPTIYQLSSPDGNNPAGSSIQINFSTRANN